MSDGAAEERGPAGGLTHVTPAGAAHMVDVGEKPVTARTATARGTITMRPEALALIEANALAKGDVLAVARLAGVLAAKRTSELIPLCHLVPLTHVAVSLTPDAAIPGIVCEASASATARTGVEMEAILAVTIALVTVYDMAKSADRDMILGDVRLVAKSGGRHGDYRAAPGAVSGPGAL